MLDEKIAIYGGNGNRHLYGATIGRIRATDRTQSECATRDCKDDRGVYGTESRRSPSKYECRRRWVASILIFMAMRQNHHFARFARRAANRPPAKRNSSLRHAKTPVDERKSPMSTALIIQRNRLSHLFYRIESHFLQN